MIDKNLILRNLLLFVALVIISFFVFPDYRSVLLFITSLLSILTLCMPIRREWKANQKLVRKTYDERKQFIPFVVLCFFNMIAELYLITLLSGYGLGLLLRFVLLANLFLFVSTREILGNRALRNNQAIDTQGIRKLNRNTKLLFKGTLLFWIATIVYALTRLLLPLFGM